LYVAILFCEEKAGVTVMIPSAGTASFVDLGAYFDRISYSGDHEPNYEVLEALHLAHATHIPFENLDILLGRRVHLDLVLDCVSPRHFKFTITPANAWVQNGIITGFRLPPERRKGARVIAVNYAIKH
jgi:hypothetical protein